MRMSDFRATLPFGDPLRPLPQQYQNFATGTGPVRAANTFFTIPQLKTNDLFNYPFPVCLDKFMHARKGTDPN